MRVLVVDQDSAATTAIARSLRDRYTVDAVSSKAHCLDLLRANAFEVIVAGERLEDGSGLELLSQIAKKWPSTLRIFAADRHRLQLLKGRLGPFQLFRTLPYPIDPERLADILTLIEAPQDAQAESSDLRPVAAAPDAQTEPAEVDQANAGSAHSRSHEPGRPSRHTRGAKRSARLSPGGHAVKEAATPSFIGGGTLRQRSRQSNIPEQVTTLPRSDDFASTAAPSQNEIESTRTLYVIGGVIAATLATIIVGVRIWGSGESPAPTVSRVPAASHTAAPDSKHPFADSKSRAAVANTESVHKNAHLPTSRAGSRHDVRAAAHGAHESSGARELEVATTLGSDMPSAGASDVSVARNTDLPTEGSAAPIALTADAAPDRKPDSANTATVAVQHSASAETAAAGTLIAAALRPTDVTDAGTTPAGLTRPATMAPRRAKSDEPPPVIREARLIHSVAVVYPAAARRDGVVGSVDLDVIVSQQGAVKDILVTRAEPAGVFDKAATVAVHKWKYDPQYVDGLPVDAHVKVHLDFQPD